jgi:8-oxo-dGTP pyrophosphatase MutT (NUDIX family)
MAVEAAVRFLVDRAMPALDAETEAVVEAHWLRAAAGRALFNGRVFCADEISAGTLHGHWTEYRRIVAQMAEPALFEVLHIRSVAVCGVLCCPDGIVVGRREAGSVYQAGLWQMPPAGSVDHGAAIEGGADWRAAVLAELQEELGVPPEAAQAMTPFLLVQHPTGVLDMGIRIDTAMSATEILARHCTLGDGEYDQLRVIPRAELPAAIASEGGALVPAAGLFLRHLPR